MIVREGGFRGMWKGWVPNVQRAALVNLGGLCTDDLLWHGVNSIVSQQYAELCKLFKLSQKHVVQIRSMFRSCNLHCLFFGSGDAFCELRYVAVLWLDLTTYDTVKHLILTKTSLKDNPVTHTLARCSMHVFHSCSRRCYCPCLSTR